MEEFRVKSAPPSVYYIPDFVTDDEAAYLWRQVYAAPRTKWTQLSNRRVQNWGGLPQPKGMIQEVLPKWLADVSTKISAFSPTLFNDNPPNHVLVNEYLPGQGIMPHTDGPLYLPVVTTISLGSHTLLDFYHPLLDTMGYASLGSRYLLSLLLEPRSLLVLKNEMYTNYLHGISERSEDVISGTVSNLSQLSQQRTLGTKLQRSTRISLTVRNVPKTFKIKLNVGLGLRK